MDGRYLKALLLIVSLLLVIFLSNILLGLFFPQDFKAYLSSEGHYANCYSSESGDYFPIDLSEEDHGFQQMFNLSDEELKNLTLETPFCINYDIEKRMEGDNPGRDRQVAIVGDSFAFGEGIKYEDTLAYLLNQEFSDTNFRNLAFSGNNVYDVYSLAKGLEGVDQVIYVYNLNDASLAESMKLRQEYINDFQNIRFEKVERSWLENHISLVRAIRDLIIMKRESVLTTNFYKDVYFSRENEEQLGYTLGWIQDMDQKLGERNISFIVYIYPLMHKEKGVYLFEDIHLKLAEELESRGIEYLDLQYTFSDYESLERFHVHRIDMHPDGAANRMVARYIYDNP